MANWKLGNLATWQPGNLATWHLDHVATQQLGNFATWHLGILELGNMAIRNLGIRHLLGLCWLGGCGEGVVAVVSVRDVVTKRNDAVVRTAAADWWRMKTLGSGFGGRFDS